jgi:hypothetical protein
MVNREYADSRQNDPASQVLLSSSATGDVRTSENLATRPIGPRPVGLERSPRAYIATKLSEGNGGRGLYLRHHCPALSSPAETAAKSFPWSASALSPGERASLVLMLVRNELSRPQLLQVQLSDRALAIELPPDSVGTLAMKPA